MTDWTDEVKARLEVDADEMVKEFRSAGSKRQGADIRAALGEIERRGPHPDDLGIPRDAAGLSARCAELRDRLVTQGKRAEAAEAKLALWESLPASMREYGIETGDLPVNVGAAIAQAIGTLRAKVQRLTGVLGLVLIETGLQAHKHGCPERKRRPAQWDQTLPCAGCAAEAALRTQEDR